MTSSMLPISSQELAQIQADAAALLDQPVIIARKTKVKDGRGSFQTTYNQISPPGLMAGLALPNGEHLTNYDYLIGAMDSWQVKLPFGTVCDVQDRITFTNLNLTLEVQLPLAPQSYPALTVVLASVIR